jgi:hypothetical protein
LYKIVERINSIGDCNVMFILACQSATGISRQV